MAYIPSKRLENAAIEVLQQYEAEYDGISITPPVPVEEILEMVFKVTPLEEDLAAKFRSNDVLAESIVYKDGTVKLNVDHSIYPYSHPDKEPRFRFTLGHEIGHFKLHLPGFVEDMNARRLWEGDTPKQMSICRSGSKEEKEIQADMFSGFLLMPKQLILAEWEKKFGPDHGPENVFDEMRELTRDTLYPDSVRPAIVKEFAAIFNVSAESMQYRLEALKLVEFGEPQPSLF